MDARLVPLLWTWALAFFATCALLVVC